MDIREFKDLVFETGKNAGLGEMEIYVVRSKNFSTKVFQKEVDDYAIKDSFGVGFRGRYNGKVGYSYAETLDEQSVELLVTGAKANAEIIESEDEIIFYSGEGTYPEVEAFGKALAEVTPEAKIEFCKTLEAEAFAADSRVSMVNWAALDYGESEIYIANTNGLEQSFTKNGVFGFVLPMVKEGEQVKTAGKQVFSNDWSKLEPKKMAAEAVQEATSLLGASTVKSGDYRILLRHDVTSELIATFSSMFSADAVQKGLSLLHGKLGETIANSQVNLIDDPLLANLGATAPFDGEGVPTKTKDIVKDGKLMTFFHNLKTAKKDGVESTGNAARMSFKSPVGVSPTNFYLKPGTKDYESLITELQDGLIIISVQGTHSGANPVSGDFSLGAYGYLVEGGKITRAVEQITIAGNFLKLLEDIEVIGSDLEFKGRNVGAPSVILKSLAVAGN